MDKIPKELREVRKFGDEEIEVIFRKARSIEETQRDSTARMNYPPLLPCVTVENGIRIERDIAVPLRDGTIIYTGGKYDSHLLVPAIPRKYTTNLPVPVIPPEYTAWSGLTTWEVILPGYPIPQK